MCEVVGVVRARKGGAKESNQCADEQAPRASAHRYGMWVHSRPTLFSAKGSLPEDPIGCFRLPQAAFVRLNSKVQDPNRNHESELRPFLLRHPAKHTEFKMADPVRIKQETDAGSPFVEDELDEESTDLEFYDKTVQGDANGKMYLARLPAYLWQAWSELGEDEEIQIGRIRQWESGDGGLVRSHLLPSPLLVCGC